MLTDNPYPRYALIMFFFLLRILYKERRSEVTSLTPCTYLFGLRPRDWIRC